MKYCGSFLVIIFTLLFYNNGYSGNSSLLPHPGSPQTENSTGFSGNTSHYLILANGMPPIETSEPKPAKGRPPEDIYKKDVVRKEVIEQPEERKEPIEQPEEDVYVMDEDSEEFLEDTETINDPLEGYNRAIFKFNDKFYYWVLKPAARGYRAILPEKARISVRKLLSNAAMPVRLVNCALQGRMKGMAIESTRFAVNSTLGVGGFFNPAESLFHLKEQEADFDQTLGRYGMKPVFFINWPLLGPSSLRGTFGLIADTASDPTTYLVSPLIKIGIRSYEEVNETSLTIGDYEALTEPALDPYIAVRNAYFQNRRSKIKSR